MEAGVLLTLVISSLLLQINCDEEFYGHSVTFSPPQKKSDGNISLSLESRDNGRSNCSGQVSYSCEGEEVCGSFDPGAAQETDADNTGQNRWCQSESQYTAELTANAKTVSLSASGCCWLSNADSVRQWSAMVHMDLATRSDTFSINNCPVSATVASLRVPQNCFTKIRLLAHDPDGDEVKCQLASSAPANFVLDENKCSLSSSGTVALGVHVFEVLLEDYPMRSINMSYPDGTKKQLNVSNVNLEPLCIVKLLFSLEVLSPLSNCEEGHVQPMFLSKTPSPEAVLYASVGQAMTIYAQAQARHSTIRDFQISGPRDMTKEFKDNAHGKAEVTLSWTPQHQDLNKHVPVCFTAETDETQSEMRCVVVVVTKATITHGKADVSCKSNKMSVSLEIASMPGIDVNFLMLLDKKCSLTSNDTHIMGTMSFSACGTRIEDKGDYIVFSNEIDSFELPTEVITRRKRVKIGFSCQFPKYVSVSTYFNLHQDDYIFTESTFGSFGYTFEIYKDRNFTKKIQPNEYPVQVKLFQMIYMSIQATSDLESVDLFVESCKATPDSNPNNPLHYYVIKDGCKTDETLRIESSQDTTFNFEVQAFKFTGNYDQVYIMCSVMLCEKDNPFSRCSQGCVEDQNQARRRRRRSLSKETADHIITQGPFLFVGDDNDNDDQSENVGIVAEQDLTTMAPVKDQEEIKNQTTGTTPHPTSPALVTKVYDANGDKYNAVMNDKFGHRGIRDMLGSNIIAVIFATAFVISIVVMVILVCYFTRKKRQEDMKMLLDTDEN